MKTGMLVAARKRQMPVARRVFSNLFNATRQFAPDLSYV
jgi:hypothetical protein